MEPVLVISILGGLILLTLLVGTPIKAVKFVGQGCIKLLVGALLLFFLNTVGAQFDIHLPINLATSSVSGFLGIPGIAALVVIDLWVF